MPRYLYSRALVRLQYILPILYNVTGNYNTIFWEKPTFSKKTKGYLFFTADFAKRTRKSNKFQFIAPLDR